MNRKKWGAVMGRRTRRILRPLAAGGVALLVLVGCQPDVDAVTSGDDSPPSVIVGTIQFQDNQGKSLGEWDATENSVTGPSSNPVFPSDTELMVGATGTDHDGGTKSVTITAYVLEKSCSGSYLQRRGETRSAQSTDSEAAYPGKAVPAIRSAVLLAHPREPLDSKVQFCWSEVQIFATAENYSGKKAQTVTMTFSFDRRPNGGPMPQKPPPPPPQVHVPNVVGSTFNDAIDTLHASNLTSPFFTNLSREVDGNKLYVVSQSPAAGELVDQGSGVFLTVDIKLVTYSKLTLSNVNSDGRSVIIFSRIRGSSWTTENLAYGGVWSRSFDQRAIYDVVAVDTSMVGCSGANPDDTNCRRWSTAIIGDPNGVQQGFTIH